MAEDKTLRLIIGIILVLFALPGATMVSMMGRTGIGYGMMGTGAFYLTGYLLTIGLLVLGIWLIADSIKK